MTEEEPINIEEPQEEKEDSYTDDGLFKISSWGADLSFRELIARYDDDELVKPEIQRNYVWDRVEASRFIDSVLLGLPLPSIFLAKTSNEKLLIIDGYQRLMTIRDFVKGIFTADNTVFSLSSSNKIHERWRGKTFIQLSPEEQRKIRNSTIHAIIFMQQKEMTNDEQKDITKEAPKDTSLYQIFERINTSGRSLLPQEIRNCVYQGPFNSLLIELNKLTKWRKLIGNEKPDSRMRDLELILRFFALSDDFILKSEKAPYNISLKKYLNEFMDSKNKPKYIPDLREKFITTLDFVQAKFGESAFHNISPSDPTKLVPNLSSTVFDAIMISGWQMAQLDSAKAVPGEKLQQRKLELLKNEDYQKILSQETMRSQNIRKRVELMTSALLGSDK